MTTELPNFTWLPSDEEAYDEAMNVLPPADMRSGMFLLGEPIDADSHGWNRYRVHRHDRETDSFLVGGRPITLAEFQLLTGPR